MNNPGQGQEAGITAQVQIRVLLFAGLKERAGTGVVEVAELAAGSNVGQLLEQLSQRWPFLRDYPLATARNQQVVGRDEVLEDGDEVALLPPVSGGSR